MKKGPKEIDKSVLQIPLKEFLEFYNKNIPDSFPHASTVLLKNFQKAHMSLFKHGDLWSLDQHRKKVIEWLPRNSNLV